MKNLITTIKSWNVENAKKLQKNDKNNEWQIITRTEDFSPEKIASINPRYIFLPHWSWIIPEEIWRNYETVVFHETDLPFGKGSRPIQNLIIQGYNKTKISALRVNEKIDGGDIYLKKELDISKGNVHDILKKSSEIVFKKMIPEIMKGIKPYQQSWDDVDNYFPRPESGKAFYFKRKTIQECANLTHLLKEKNSIEQIHRIIRALQDDYECGDPKAYIEIPEGRIELYDARIIRGLLKFKAEFIKTKDD